MSMQYAKAAWNAEVAGGRKIVLLALADLTRDDDNGLSWPSVATLTKLCGASERTVQAHLTWLEEAGFVTRVFRQGSRTRYQLTDPVCWPQIAWNPADATSADFAPPQELPPADLDSDPRKSCAEPPQILQETPADFAPIKAAFKSNPKSNLENKPTRAALAMASGDVPESTKPTKAKKPTKRTDDSDEAAAAGWQEFWSAYPRADGKKAARKAWNRIAPDDPLQARMLAAIAVQRRSDAWRKEGGNYIPHAATWLNGERWTDSEPKPGAIGAQPMTERERLQQQLVNATSANDRMAINCQLAMLKGDGGAAIEGDFLEVPTLPGYVPRDRRSDDELLADMLRSQLPPPASKALALQEDDA